MSCRGDVEEFKKAGGARVGGCATESNRLVVRLGMLGMLPMVVRLLLRIVRLFLLFLAQSSIWPDIKVVNWLASWLAVLQP